MNRLKAWILDLCYPNVCDCCGKRIAFDACLCSGCTESLERMRISFAMWRGTVQEKAWETGAVLFPYLDTAKNGVLSLKDGHRNFAAYAGRLLAEEIRMKKLSVDAVVCVPMAKRRRIWQGYSHTEILGRIIAENLQVPLYTDILEEHYGSVRQHQLSAKERRAYAGRFYATGKLLKQEHILLVDDILTTGWTMQQCAALLRQQGAAAVTAAAVCAVVPRKKSAENST
ncbi:MAG: hypothetical protein MJ071_05010 [Oscillospiraceae bacterium]|nr:hypothetical protein [Oscillospiraceae bacterium]